MRFIAGIKKQACSVRGKCEQLDAAGNARKRTKTYAASDGIMGMGVSAEYYREQDEVRALTGGP